MDIKKKLIAEESKILDDKINLMKNELYKNDNIILRKWENGSK